MKEKELRLDIILASLESLRKKLIARTWGNVSARLDDEHFLITPSGLDYTSMKSDDLVIVNLADLSYDKSQRKPSSEKRIHSAAYKYYKDVNFVIHTHQPYASAICAEGKNVTLDDGTILPCAGYGLPGTKKLAENVENCFRQYPNARCFLMEKHGAIIMGKDKEETIYRAVKLEEHCRILYEKRVKNKSAISKELPYLDDYAQIMPPAKNEDEEAVKLVKEKNDLANAYVKNAKPLSFIDRNLQHIVYRLKYSKMRNR